MGINILFKNDVSLEELIQIKNNGGSVIRSSHIGNWNKSTLALGKLNFHIILHEFLKGTANLYEPASIKIENIKETLSKDSEKLQLYDNTFCYKNLKYYKPSKFHLDNLMKMDNDIETISSYFLRNKNYIEKVVDILLDYYPNEFNKYIDSNGVVYNFHEVNNNYIYYKFKDSVIRFEIEEARKKFINLLISTNYCLVRNVRDNPEGILPSTKIYLLLTCINEILEKKLLNKDKIELYHFSGTQMINYLIKNSDTSNDYNIFLNNSYNLIKNFIGGLPTEVNFNLVQTDFIKFISCKKSEDCVTLDYIYELYLEILRLKEIKKQLKGKYIKYEINKLEGKKYEELLQIIESLKDNLNIRRYKKLLILAKKMEIKKIINELANIYLLDRVAKDKNIILLERKICDLEDNLSKIIFENINLFSDNITQNDLLNNNDDIYITRYGLNMQINDIMGIMKYCKNDKKKKKQPQKHLYTKILD